VTKNRLSLPSTSSDDYLRVIGPKNVHAPRTLHFLSPEEYRAAKAADRENKKKLSQLYGSRKKTRSGLPMKSTVIINSLKFEEHRY